MIDITPEYKVRKIFCDIKEGIFKEGIFKEGEYLVTVKKGRKPGTVYQVCSIRKINSRVHLNRYALEVITRPNLLDSAKITFRFRAFVGQIEAHPIFWYNKKHRPKS